MPTLNDLVGLQNDPTITQTISTQPVIEPLDGPSTVDDVMDRFPEEVYQQGKDTHLYRFLTALGGDSGAGLLKAQAYVARLKYEANFLNFQVLDEQYAAQFSFNRLPSETYPDFNPDTDALTPDEWDSIELADQHYKQRIAEFFTALRLGTSPGGLQIAAQSGCGVDVELIEQYKWIFDQFSDDPLGLQPFGKTVSTSEFVIIPRLIGDESANPNLEYSNPIPKTYTFTGTTSMPNARPSLGGVRPSVTIGFGTTAKTALLPSIDRNMVEILDRARPTNTYASVFVDQARYSEIGINDAHASSERLNASRLVEGSVTVPWPPLDSSQNFFIQSGVENEAGTFYGSARELPTIFDTLETIHAYTEKALSDPSYGSSAFFDASSGIAPYDNYRSEHVGFFNAQISALFPFVATLTADANLVAGNAPAITNTPLVLEGRQVAPSSS